MPHLMTSLFDIGGCDELSLTGIPRFRREQFSDCLLDFLSGQVLPRHSHTHEHGVFDTLEGSDTIWIDRRAIKTQPGTSLFVPDGTEDEFKNDSDEPWLIQATIYQRICLRSGLKRTIVKQLVREAR